MDWYTWWETGSWLLVVPVFSEKEAGSSEGNGDGEGEGQGSGVRGLRRQEVSI